MSPSSTHPPTRTRAPRPTGPAGELGQQPALAHPSIASYQHQLRPSLLGPVHDRRKSAQLFDPTDERWAREPASHARQYGRSQRGRKRAGEVCRPVPARCGRHLGAHWTPNQPPPGPRCPLAASATLADTHYPSLGGGLPPWGHEVHSQHLAQPCVHVVHACPPIRVPDRFGLDGRAKAPATTSGPRP
jgi:hypothetical protein